MFKKVKKSTQSKQPVCEQTPDDEHIQIEVQTAVQKRKQGKSQATSKAQFSIAMPLIEQEPQVQNSESKLDYLSRYGV